MSAAFSASIWSSVVAEPVEDLAGVLADARRRAVDVRRRLGELDELAELAQRPHDRVLVLGDEPEPLVVGVEEHEVAGLGVDRDLVRHAGVVERAGPRDRVLAAKRAASSASSSSRFSWRRSATANRASSASSGTPSTRHSATHSDSFTAAIWIQPSWVS